MKIKQKKKFVVCLRIKSFGELCLCTTAAPLRKSRSEKCFNIIYIHHFREPKLIGKFPLPERHRVVSFLLRRRRTCQHLRNSALFRCGSPATLVVHFLNCALPVRYLVVLLEKLVVGRMNRRRFDRRDLEFRQLVAELQVGGHLGIAEK